MVINVGLGLGEGVVSGTVEVDQVHVSKHQPAEGLEFRYLVGDKRACIVLDRRTGWGTTMEDTLFHQRLRPALEYSDLRDLVRTAVQLDGIYAQPLDIEFSFEDGSLQVLQARPIASFEQALAETVRDYPLSVSVARKEAS